MLDTTVRGPGNSYNSDGLSVLANAILSTSNRIATRGQ